MIKDILSKLYVLILILFALPQMGSSQDDLDFELTYEVNRIYPYISITNGQLKEARTLIDLNTHYKSSWISEYISVELLSSYKGKTKSAVSKNDTLSEEQRKFLSMVDVGTEISVKVKYMPENTLTHNDAKEINFTVAIDPEMDAEYQGGKQELQQYLRENVIDKISQADFDKYNLSAIKFAIGEEGEIVDTRVFESTNDDNIDELLLEAICNMPNWKPAEYYNGVKVKQEFVFTIGDMQSCILGLLNIRRLEE